MSKTLKIILVLSIILCSICSFSLATDIDMNITSNNTVTETNNTINETTNNVTNTTKNTTNNDTTNTLSDNQVSASSTANNEYTSISSIDKSATDDGLGLSNILNILLIVVGVVLILLAIAILIRLHG